VKRTKYIDLESLRKTKKNFSVKPLVLAMAAVLAGCSQKQEDVKFVNSVSDCAANTSMSTKDCEAAYQKALAEAERTGPKYRNRYECETEFGDNRCTQNTNGYFMPFMTGFLVSSAINSLSHRYNPVYAYHNPYSNHRGRLMMSDGTILGRSGSRHYSLPKGSATKKMPTATRTVSRGGFGSVASAKSSWGSARSRGWGG